MNEFDRPVLLIDTKRCKRNIRRIEIYGLAVEYNQNRFGNILPDNYMKSLLQEHGRMEIKSDISAWKPGDQIAIYPVHSCLTVNVFDHFLILEGKRIKKRVLS